MMSTATPSLPFVVCTPAEAAREIATEMLDLVASRARAGRSAVFGLATGRSPLEIYAELVQRVRTTRFALDNVWTFNLDEYLGLPARHPQSFAHYMRERVFGPLGIHRERGILPASDLAPSQVAAHCRAYERAIAEVGGLDLQILGIGRNGHIGFNEPGSTRECRTREVMLDETTRADAAANFGGLERVPTRAITMGVATILEARRIRVLAFGASKSAIVRRTLEDAVGPDVPATYLREHSDVRLYVDAAALGGLSRSGANR